MLKTTGKADMPAKRAAAAPVICDDAVNIDAVNMTADISTKVSDIT
jgi:hypothetical protein